MTKGLGWKVILIVAVVLIFAYGIFGIPAGFSGGALADALLSSGTFRNGIHLGLDLKGGTHLILQVQVNDAINADSDTAIESLKDGLRKAKVNYTDITKPDPVNRPEQIVIKGVPPESSSALRDLVSSRLPQYDAASGANDTWTVTMKPTALTAMKDQAVTQAIETIRNRVDQLGVAEPIIEEHGLGQYQILVELPGIDDPARVKDVIKSTAVLDIRLLSEGPFSSQDTALQAKAGQLDADQMLMQGRNEADGSETWYIVSRIPAVRGTDLRSAQPTQDENGRPAVGLISPGTVAASSMPSLPPTSATSWRWFSMAGCRVRRPSNLRYAILESSKAASRTRK